MINEKLLFFFFRLTSNIDSLDVLAHIDGSLISKYYKTEIILHKSFLERDVF